MENRINQLLKDWHEAGRIRFQKTYGKLNYDEDCPKRAVYKKKYVYLDERNSGAYILDKDSGIIYRLKSKYGVPNKKKPVGHIDTITGNDLALNRWY